MPTREPLGPLSLNRPLPSSSPYPSSSSSSSCSRKTLKLAPIFTSNQNSRKPRLPHSSSTSIQTQENSSPTPHARKRARLDLVNDEEEEDAVEPLKYEKRSGFISFPATGSSSSSESRARAEKVHIQAVVVEPSPEPTRPGWSRRRVRLGVNGRTVSSLSSFGTTSTSLFIHPNT